MPWPKILVPLVIGIVTGAGAWMVYQHSSHTEVPAPSYATVVLQSRLRLALITYQVSQQPHDTAIDISVKVHAGALSRGGPAQTLQLIPPNDISFFKCLDCAESAAQIGKVNQPVTLMFTSAGSGFEKADVSYQAPAGFGDIANGLDASAAIPHVSYQCIKCLDPGNPQLKADYILQRADRYNWTPAVEYRGGNEVWWAEPVVADGETPGSVATGVDPNTQQWDNTLTFAAGALVGVAGGALLTMVTELLHAHDDRGGPRAPGVAGQADRAPGHT
jgi:hypothetical protein